MGPFDHLFASPYPSNGPCEMRPISCLETEQMGDENMKKRKFKVGDKVRVLYGSLVGMIGKIAFVRNGYTRIPYIVVFDENVDMLEQDQYTVNQIAQKGYDYRKCWLYDCDELELVEEEEMKNVKSLLKSGDIVVFGSGEKAKVFLDYESDYYGKGILAYIDKDSFMALESYNEDLFTSTKLERYAINKIYRPKYDNSVMSSNLNDYDFIWERKEVKEMTMKEICEALGYEVKIKKEDK